MAAPIRFLSGRNQQQKIGIEGSTDNQKVLEVVGRVGIGTTIFEPTSELEVRGGAIISGILTASNIEVSAGQVNFSQLNVTGVSTFGNTIDSNGRIVGAATSNVIPFLYSNFTDLPSAATYHGAFAHVHSTGKAYYAHAGNWVELVNKEVNGTVGTGTERYNIGPVDLTTLDVSGISTFAGAADFNGNVDIDGHTELDDVNVSGIATVGILTATTLRGLNTKVYNVLEVDGVSWFDGGAEFGPRSFNKGYASISTAGIATFAEVNVSGISTFSDDVTFTGTSYNAVWESSGDILRFEDNAKAVFGTNSDLQIYSDNSDSYIINTQNNDIIIGQQVNDKSIQIKSDDGSGGSAIYLKADGSSGEIIAYHYGSQKFATKSNGIDVTGHTETDTLNVSGVSTFAGAIDANGSIDVDGHTELDDLNVSGVSTFAGAIDANGGLDVSGGSGLVASSAKISDLTDNRIVIAGASGELEDSSKVTFNGTTLAIVGNATFTGNVSVAGTLTSEDKTNIDSIGIVTARTGVRINSGGLVVSSGVSTFTDSIDANGGVDATTAKVSDLTSGRVVTVGTGGELQDNSNLTFDGTTLTANSLAGNGSNITDISLSNVIGAINGITIREEGTIVGSANSTGSVNFVSSNLTASASGVGATITLTDNPSFTNLSATNVSASSSITGNFHGDGSKIININVDQVVGAVSGITIREEGNIVGAANSVGNINFVSSNLTASASGVGATITFTDTPTFDTVTVTNNITANGNIVGDNSTNISGISALTAAGTVTFGADADDVQFFGTSKILRMGGTSGFQIQEAGTSASITQGTGELNFYYDSGNQYKWAIFNNAGSVELYHANNKKFETTSSGVSVTGIVTATTFSGTATQVTVADESSDTTCFPLFVTAATGGLAPKSGSNLTFNSADGTLTATDFNTTSDENLKDNIRTIEDPLAKVVEIRGVNFDWKETQKPSVGVIAQEVEKVFPELVANGEKKTVNYNGLIGLLIEVVKEQQTQINSLNERLSQLE